MGVYQVFDVNQVLDSLPKPKWNASCKKNRKNNTSSITWREPKTVIFSGLKTIRTKLTD